ncbi:MAG: hypothetical protein H6622_14620 [Halobacteriovoraceae bacterium]|nr:hypothetical protein [Halobacteriovoraceae bacterium]
MKFFRFFILCGLIVSATLSIAFGSEKKNQFLPIYSQKQIATMPYVQLKSLHQQYARFFLSYERRNQDLFNKKNSFKGSFNFPKFLMNTLAPEAHADLIGMWCFIGGYRSEVNGGLCSRPKGTSCSNGKFKCRESFFGENVCVDSNRNQNYAWITKKCYENRNITDESLRNNLQSMDFQTLQSEVNEFCSDNPSYDACETLKTILAKYNSNETPSGDDAIIPEVIDVVDNTNDTGGIIPGPGGSGSDDQITCHTQIQFVGNSCPETIQNISERPYSIGGIVRGSLDLLSDYFDGTNRSTARKLCSYQAQELSKVKASLIELDKDFTQASDNTDHVSLSHVPSRCYQIKEAVEKGVGEMNVSDTYTAFKIENDNNRLRNGHLLLQETLAHMNMTLGVVGEKPAQIDCKSLVSTNLIEKCESLNACSSQTDQSLIDDKVENTIVALKAISEIEKKKSTGDWLSKEGLEKRDELNQIIESYRQSNPWLKGENFNGDEDSFFDRDGNPQTGKIKNALISQFKIDRKKVIQNLNDYNKALKCITSDINGCDDYNEVIAKTPEFSFPTLPKASEQYKKGEQYFSCVKNHIQNQDEADTVLNDAGLSFAATLVTLGTTGFGGGVVASTSVGASAARTASTLMNSAKNLVLAKQATFLGTTTAFTIHEWNKVSKVCNSFTDSNGALSNSLSCSEMKNKILSYSSANTCKSEALTAAAFVAVPWLAPQFAKITKKGFNKLQLAIAKGTSKNPTVASGPQNISQEQLIDGIYQREQQAKFYANTYNNKQPTSLKGEVSTTTSSHSSASPKLESETLSGKYIPAEGTKQNIKIPERQGETIEGEFQKLATQEKVIDGIHAQQQSAKQIADLVSQKPKVADTPESKELFKLNPDKVVRGRLPEKQPRLVETNTRLPQPNGKNQPAPQSIKDKITRVKEMNKSTSSVSSKVKDGTIKGDPRKLPTQEEVIDGIHAQQRSAKQTAELVGQKPKVSDTPKSKELFKLNPDKVVRGRLPEKQPRLVETNTRLPQPNGKNQPAPQSIKDKIARTKEMNKSTSVLSESKLNENISGDAQKLSKSTKRKLKKEEQKLKEEAQGFKDPTRTEKKANTKSKASTKTSGTNARQEAKVNELSKTVSPEFRNLGKTLDENRNIYNYMNAMGKETFASKKDLLKAHDKLIKNLTASERKSKLEKYEEAFRIIRANKGWDRN